MASRGRRKQAKPQRKVEVDEPSTMTLTDSPQSSSIANSDNNHNEIVENPETLRVKGPPKTTAPNSAETFTNGLNLLIQHQLGSSEDDDSDDDESSLRIDEDFEPIQKASSLPNGLIKEEDLAATPAPEYFIKCPQCQKGCQTFQALKEHMEAAHQDLSMTSSDRGSDASLSRLGAASPTPPPSSAGGQGGQFGCSQCAASFPCKDQLEKHELLHSPHAQVCCKVCNKTFANVYRLQRHMISHDESAILRKFKCTECEKAFKFKHHLKEHIRIHSGEKPFECTNCGKRFSHSGSFSSHMTSKKCLVMNLKLGRTRSTISNNLLDKSAHQQTPRAPKRPNISPINNNITTSPNHNSYLPILPKYSDAAAAFLQSSLNGNPTLPPFYLAPPSLLNATHPISPYSIPSLSHILEHLQQQQQQSPLRPPLMESPPDERHREANSFVKSEDNDQAPSNSSECGDLVMDEDVEQDNEDKNDTSSHTSTGDLEAVKRILETVNATVTKELLQANMQKVNSENSSECHSVASAHSPKQTFSCTACRKTFDSSLSLEDHECEDLRSEGLAAKLEDALTAKSDDAQIGSVSDDDQDYERMHYSTNDEIDSESFATTDHMSEDGRKVRVRSLISDEQLKVLKDNYKLNPRPKREELEKIATAIGFPVRVVQVWFQNTRARDRREGKLIQVPYSPASLSSYPAPAKIHPRSVSPNPSQYNEQPLDLSIKREVASNESSPVSSPCRPASEGHSMETTDEVVNLSRKASRSPTPYHPYHHSQYHNSNSSEPRQSPSPMDLNSSRLAQILVQPPHKLSLPGMGLVPMDQLMQFGAKDLPSLSHFFSSRMSSLSPNAEKRTWSDRDAASEMAEEDLSKRAKMSQFVLKSLSSPVLGQDSEVEGQFICDQCDKAFSKQSSLARHKYEHSGQRPHKCNECPKAFKHKHHLTEHKRLHTGEKPFECKKCLKRFSHSGSFSQHMNHRYSYCKPYRQ